ncbi:unnamed protein product, partial [Mesorhabditis belari]|uniref:Serine carboxypeptidase n=1 Tax=Mesorhabditis belari TaxID=2138241 RepID=A0AAF3FR70_9BILA
MRSLIFSLLLVGVYGGASNTVNTWNGTLSYIEDWGYVKIRDNANTFWWLYSVQPSNNRPLFLWLQGGPGSSSSGYGNLEELGPKDLDGKDRASTWLLAKLDEGRGMHSTVANSKTAKIDDDLLANPRQLRKLVSVFYFDYLIFQYALPKSKHLVNINEFLAQ